MEPSLSNLSLSAHEHLPQTLRMNSTNYNSTNNLIGNTNFSNANNSSNGTYSLNVNENQSYPGEYYSPQNANMLQQNRNNSHNPKVVLIFLKNFTL